MKRTSFNVILFFIFLHTSTYAFDLNQCSTFFSTLLDHSTPRAEVKAGPPDYTREIKKRIDGRIGGLNDAVSQVYTEALDLTRSAIARNLQFKTYNICGPVKKELTVWRRTSKKIVSSSEFTYDTKKIINAIESAQNGDAKLLSTMVTSHVNAATSAEYIGVGTLMKKDNAIAGGGGNVLCALNIHPGSIVCIISGVEAELVLMDAVWTVISCR